MLLEHGHKFTRPEGIYRIIRRTYFEIGYYREEYSAKFIPNDGSESRDMSLIVYAPERIKNVSVNAAVVEAELRQRLHSDAFEKYLYTFTDKTASGEIINVLVLGYMDTMPVRLAVQYRTLSEEAVWQVFSDIVTGLDEIYTQADGACHFNLDPDTVHIRIDENERCRGVVRALNAVTNDFHHNENIDKETIKPDCRAPESYTMAFRPTCMQYSLAVLLIFLLTRKHPWNITNTITNFRAYLTHRQNKPVVDVPGELGEVLKRAISVDTSKRFKTINDFVMEVAKCTGMVMPDTYRGFGHNGKPSEVETKEEKKMDPHENTSSSDARLNVAMRIKRGKGFNAVAGMENEKKDLTRNLINVVKHKELAEKYQIEPVNYIFVGPPGTGKTYLAERVAEELGIEYSLVNPSDLANTYIHGSQTMIKELFEKAEKQARDSKKAVLIVFDEIDCLMPNRAKEDNHIVGEVSEFLTQLNGCTSRGIIVIGTTNNIERMDKAVLRKGRFDKIVWVNMPDEKSRKMLFDYELSKRPHTDDIDLDKLARLTDGFNSSDISYIVKESARIKFDDAIDRDSKDVIDIDQAVLEEVIRSTNASVSKTDLIHYDEMKQRYADTSLPVRRSVGFNV